MPAWHASFTAVCRGTVWATITPIVNSHSTSTQPLPLCNLPICTAGPLRKLTPCVSHVLPVSDDGGSTAEIVRVIGGPAVGDIRSRCLRLADDGDAEVSPAGVQYKYQRVLVSASRDVAWLCGSLQQCLIAASADLIVACTLSTQHRVSSCFCRSAGYSLQYRGVRVAQLLQPYLLSRLSAHRLVL